MFKKKYKQFNNSTNKSKLDQVLWFIENYLPQKKDRGVQKNLYMDNLEAETIKKFLDKYQCLIRYPKNFKSFPINQS